MSEPILVVEDLVKTFEIRSLSGFHVEKRSVQAVTGVPLLDVADRLDHRVDVRTVAAVGPRARGPTRDDARIVMVGEDAAAHRGLAGRGRAVLVERVAG